MHDESKDNADMHPSFQQFISEPAISWRTWVSLLLKMICYSASYQLKNLTIYLKVRDLCLYQCIVPTSFGSFFCSGKKMLETMTRNHKNRDIVQIQVMCS
jgi:hypothetical protein